MPNSHLERYIKMQQYAEFRRPYVLKMQSDLHDVQDLWVNYKTELRLLKSDVLFLCTDSRDAQRLYFFDSVHNKLIQFSSKEGSDKRSLLDKVQNLRLGETDFIMHLLNKDIYPQYESEKINPNDLMSIRNEAIQLPYDGFLIIRNEQASLDLTSIFQNSELNQYDLQWFGMQGESANDVCFELISTFIDQNKSKQKLVINYPDFIKFSPEQKQQIELQLKKCNALQSLECKHLDFPNINLDAFKQAQLEELAIKEDQIKTFKAMSGEEREIYLDSLFSDPMKKKDRIQFMQNLYSRIYISTEMPLGQEDYSWTIEQNNSLLQRGLDNYVELTKVQLSKTNQLSAILTLSKELFLIGGDPDSSHPSPIKTELKGQLHQMMDEYKRQGFHHSNERKDQLKALQQKLSPDNDYKTILNHLRDAKINALRQDDAVNQERQNHWFWKHFLVNRSGESRFLNTVNKMHDEVLNHWLQNLHENQDAIDYYDYITQDFKMLVHQLKTTCQHYPDFLLLAESLDLKEDASADEINILLSEVKSHLTKFPKEILTVAKEVLLRGEPLLDYLIQQENSMGKPVI